MDVLNVDKNTTLFEYDTYILDYTKIAKTIIVSKDQATNIYLPKITKNHIGGAFTVVQGTDKQLTFTYDQSVILNSYGGGNKTYGLWSSVQIIVIDEDTYLLMGAV